MLRSVPAIGVSLNLYLHHVNSNISLWSKEIQNLVLSETSSLSFSLLDHALVHYNFCLCCVVLKRQPPIQHKIIVSL